MLGAGMVNKVFSPGISINISKNGNKLALINVPFRHNSSFVIQKWLIFTRVVITVTLTYIS